MTKVYKLTDKDGYTRKGEYNQCRWGPNVTHTATGDGGLCTSGCIHAYTSPELALFLNPSHANMPNPRLWEATMEVVYSDRGLKVGGRSLTTVRELSFNRPTTRQKVIFAVLCADKALELNNHTFSEIFLRNINKWHQWKREFLKNPKLTAAYAARAAVYAAAVSAARAADAAADSAAAAAVSAARAADSYIDFNLDEIARRAMEYDK